MGTVKDKIEIYKHVRMPSLSKSEGEERAAALAGFRVISSFEGKNTSATRADIIGLYSDGRISKSEYVALCKMAFDEEG